MLSWRDIDSSESSCCGEGYVEMAWDKLVALHLLDALLLEALDF